MASNDLLIGKKFGDYELKGPIGQGGMARIYRGYDDKLQRYAAIKVFDAQGVPFDELDEYRQRFMREARSIARLRHPQIVSVYQTGQYEDLLYMAMMYIEGRDLRHILKEHVAHNTRMTRIDILRIISDIATALDYAHREGVIHRDIKPSNIMITADGHAILTDFGLALSVPEGTIGTTFGSVHYIAPEQATNSAMAKAQSDLYSLGVVLYEMLTGKVPFDDASAMSIALRHLNELPPPPTLFNPEITPSVESMVLHALDKDPQKRYQSGTAFIAALENAFGMTDEDELTRRLKALPDWVQNPELSNIHKPPALAESSKPSAVQRAVSAGSTPRPSAPVIIALGDEKTISDASGVGRPLPWTSQQTTTSHTGRNLMLIGGGIVLLAVLAIIILLAFNEDTPGVAQAVTATVTAITDTTPTDVPASPTTDETTPDEAVIPINSTNSDSTPDMTTLNGSTTGGVILDITPTPTGQASTPRPTVNSPPTIERTATLSTTATAASTSTTPEVPTVLPENTSSVANQDGEVRLVYDGQMLVLFNISDEEVDVNNLDFVQRTADGRTLTYQSNRWAGGSRSPADLPPGDCFQLWTFNDGIMPQPEECKIRHAWRQVGTIREFWISQTPGTVFEVRRGDQVLAECTISAGECVFDVKGEELG